MTGPRIRSRDELRQQRRRRSHGCWNQLIAAPLWPLHGANLGTLLRTCDAVGACLAVPKLPWVPEALAKGNTLRRKTCVHWVRADPIVWLATQQRAGAELVAVELTDESIRLADLGVARKQAVMILGHEKSGVPPEALALATTTVEIPMLGHGASLNVAVAGSLVLYRLAGLF